MNSTVPEVDLVSMMSEIKIVGERKITIGDFIREIKERMSSVFNSKREEKTIQGNLAIINSVRKDMQNHLKDNLYEFKLIFRNKEWSLVK